MCNSEEVRQRVRELLRETRTTQGRLCKDITQLYGYRASQSELCMALNGKLDTPKAHRMLVDGLGILNARAQRDQSILEASMARK